MAAITMIISYYPYYVLVTVIIDELKIRVTTLGKKKKGGNHNELQMIRIIYLEKQKFKQR